MQSATCKLYVTKCPRELTRRQPFVAARGRLDKNFQGFSADAADAKCAVYVSLALSPTDLGEEEM